MPETIFWLIFFEMALCAVQPSGECRKGVVKEPKQINKKKAWLSEMHFHEKRKACRGTHIPQILADQLTLFQIGGPL